jgi:hypothetical protein
MRGGVRTGGDSNPKEHKQGDIQRTGLVHKKNVERAHDGGEDHSILRQETKHHSDAISVI